MLFNNKLNHSHSWITTQVFFLFFFWYFKKKERRKSYCSALLNNGPHSPHLAPSATDLHYPQSKLARAHGNTGMVFFHSLCKDQKQRNGKYHCHCPLVWCSPPCFTFGPTPANPHCRYLLTCQPHVLHHLSSSRFASLESMSSAPGNQRCCHWCSVSARLPLYANVVFCAKILTDESIARR